jgi:hypothetical protein
MVLSIKDACKFIHQINDSGKYTLFFFMGITWTYYSSYELRVSNFSGTYSNTK